jgi:hypothetical protein
MKTTLKTQFGRRAAGLPARERELVMINQVEISDRRLSPRVRTFMGAHAVFNDGQLIHCQVLDISGTGAKLSGAFHAGTPLEFVLKIPSRGETYPAEIRWLAADTVGVRFLSREAAARAEDEQIRRWIASGVSRFRKRIGGWLKQL